MSMEITTIVEFIQVLFVYLACCFLVPHIVLNRHMQGKELSERFLLCLIISNFYIINMVFIIFLFHLPRGRLAFSLLTIIPAGIAWQRINRPNIRGFFTAISVAFSRLMLGEAKIKTIWDSLSAAPRLLIRRLIHSIVSHILHHLIEWGILLYLLGFNAWYYGYSTLHKYVYGTSDIVVHHSWIHEMDNGVIFAKGIYPYGFHNIIFFMHQVFHLKLVSILRVFGTIQALFIFLMIYVMLRKICHSRFVPLLGVFLFTLPNLYDFQGVMRYQWALPQEYAMLFLYPCAYFLIQYFERKKEEIKTEKEMMEKKILYAWLPKYHLLPSTRSLIFFGVSFTLTLAVHFYITIIAVLLCLAIAIAYFPIVFHYRYFFSIAVAGLLSLAAAVSPLVLGYVEGHDLEGSLRWALSTMSPGGGESTEENAEETETASNTPEETTPSSSVSPEQAGTEIQTEQTVEEKTFFEKVQEKVIAIALSVINLPNTIKQKAGVYNLIGWAFLSNSFTDSTFLKYLLWIMDGVILTAFLLGIISRRYYCRNMLAIGLYFFFMTLLICGSYYSLPTLMDSDRAKLFICYATPMILASAVDFIYSIIFRPVHYHVATELAPIGLTVLLAYLTIANNFVKPLNIVYSLQMPGEMYCNYRIMREYPQKKWTLVTTTNSIQLISDDGWLTEVFDFLKQMRNYSRDTKVTIPSKYVFFYIEKYPLSYGSYSRVNEDMITLGQVSEEEAEKTAIYDGGGVYSGENRYILESKFFYWAKAFEEKYPREFQIFYEDDTFICYRIIQNEYHLYNFALDYGFN